MRTILVSACLLGVSCRWHGQTVKPSWFVKKFVAEYPDVKLIPVCPEQLGGLSTPRPPVKMRRGRIYITCADKSKLNDVTGDDITDAFVLGAKKTLAIARKRRCKTAILMKTSPSCSRTGITGKRLLENGIDVISTL